MGTVRCGEVRFILRVWFGGVGYVRWGGVWCGGVRSGAVRLYLRLRVRFGAVGFGKVRFGEVRCDKVRYGAVR